jgi:D-beta-D-heptose 7-phosphate kinase/D-beta-D-heptose 1-phosphate adenosyltransferase
MGRSRSRGALPRDPKDKIVSLRRLVSAIKSARRTGRRVVFTNGVFDLLHPGHARLLQRARALGDLLVVAVNSDASVKRLKGPGRPFVGGRERAFMLASLEAVDHVVIFGEDTPLSVIEKVQPDVLVKGGDWKAGAIVGAEIVRARGGRVVRVPLVMGFSTTGIARRVGTPGGASAATHRRRG